MPTWFPLLLGLSSISVSTCYMRLGIVKVDDNGSAEPVEGTMRATAGANLTLYCRMEGTEPFFQQDLVWGRRTKQLRFKSELDLGLMARQGSKLLTELQNENEPYHWRRSVKDFAPLQVTDRGMHFCMSLNYMLFKIVHIQVNDSKESYLDQDVPTNSVGCSKDKFRCVTSGICINAHYKCDGRADCFDGSDEKFCGGDPCDGKIQCRDGRCIPVAWCCNKRTDESCTVAVAARPSCCPPLPDPYDPIHWYNLNNHTDIKDIRRNSGSKYLFITICVISAVLSFVLFLFVISKVCGFDTKPARSRTINTEALRNEGHTTFVCEHSECAIRREFNPNIGCLYRTSLTNAPSDLADPLINGLTSRSPAEALDQPPPYAEVVCLPPSIDKCLLDELINAPPPPYSSTKFFCETDGGDVRNNVCAADSAACINRSVHCDIPRNGSE